MRIYLNFSLLYLIFCCSYAFTFEECKILGLDEMIEDSQLIKGNGKFAIEELLGNVYEDLSEDALNTYNPKINEDDTFRINLFHPTRRDLMESLLHINNITGGFKVKDGMIAIPGFLPVKVIGLTIPEAKDKIKASLREEIKGIDLFITLQESRSNRIDITGLVRGSSTIVADGKVRLYEVLSNAKLPEEANLFASYVIRDQHPLKIDLNKLLKEGDLSQNIVMRGGDKIFIANISNKVAMVLGEVKTPKLLPLPSGFISLKEALAISNGITFRGRDGTVHTGDKRHIQVIRGSVRPQKIYVVTYDDIIYQPNDMFLLIPGDIVYVSRTPITEWHLFFNQLTGAINALGAYQLIHQMKL